MNNFKIGDKVRAETYGFSYFGEVVAVLDKTSEYPVIVNFGGESRCYTSQGHPNNSIRSGALTKVQG